MIIYMNLCNTKGVLGSRKLWYSYINENKRKFRLVFGQFSILSWREKGHELSRAELSRAELKILQLELWLEPTRLGLITIIFVWKAFQLNVSSSQAVRALVFRVILYLSWDLIICQATKMSKSIMKDMTRMRKQSLFFLSTKFFRKQII